MTQATCPEPLSRCATEPTLGVYSDAISRAGTSSSFVPYVRIAIVAVLVPILKFDVKLLVDVQAPKEVHWPS